MSDPFYRKTIYPFVSHYITNHTDIYGFNRQYLPSDMPDTALNEFAKLIIEWEETDLSFLTSDEDILTSINVSLMTIENEDKINLSDKIMEKIVEHLLPKMKEILEEAQRELHGEYLSDNYESSIDPQTGETIWGAAIHE